MMRLVCSFLALACVATTPADHVANTTAPADPAGDEFATFGVIVRAPETWSRQWEGEADVVARWSNAAPGGRATAVIKLQIEPANGRTLAQYAEALRQQHREARLGIHALVMGRQPAMRITGHDAGGNAAVDVLVALADQHFYILTGYAAVPRLLPTDVMDEMARTMQFRPPQDPAAATVLREPLTFFGRFSIAPQATMRPSAEPPASPRSLTLVTTDYRSQRPALSMEMQVLPNPQRLPLIDLAAKVTQRLARREPVSWRTSQMPLRGMSDAFDFISPDGKKVRTRLALVRLNNEEMLYLRFTVGGDTAEAQAAMENGCEQILGSVRPKATPAP